MTEIRVHIIIFCTRENWLRTSWCQEHFKEMIAFQSKHLGQQDQAKLNKLLIIYMLLSQKDWIQISQKKMKKKNLNSVHFLQKSTKVILQEEEAFLQL